MRKVMLVTKEIAKKLPPLYANDGKNPADVAVAFKIFNPYGAQTWYVTEATWKPASCTGSRTSATALRRWAT